MPKYTCSLCNFETTRKSHYTRHLESSKHKKRISTPDDNTDKDKSDDTDDFTCLAVINHSKIEWGYGDTRKHVLIFNPMNLNLK